MFRNLLLLVISYSLFVGTAHAATTSTSSASQGDAEIKKDLINRLANDAKLHSERRGIIGKVITVTSTQITITDLQNNTRFVDVDELTKFSSPNAKGTFGISDITKDSTVGILGLYNKDSRRILARFVNVVTTPLIIHGGVAKIDNENFSISVTTEEGKQIEVNVENLTKTYSYTAKTDYIKSGFSKIKENYNIIITGVLNIKDSSKMTATRIIIFPEIPVNQKVNSLLNHPSSK